MHALLLALKNVFRNRRRSFVTLAAIAFGLTAINLFSGYISNVYAGLEQQAVMGERLGHLTIFRRGFLLEGKLNPKRYLFTPDDTRKIEALIHREPGVKLISPRLSLNGLISNGEASTIFIGEGIVPRHNDLLGAGGTDDSGGRLDAKHDAGVAVSSDLAKLLNLKKGDTFSLLASTLDGQANAVDADVVDIFNTGSAGTNDKYVLTTLALAQSLMNTGSVERLVVLLDDAALTDRVRLDLARQLRDAGFDVEIKTWKELSSFYSQVRQLFDMIFSFIASIVLVISAMSVANTMSMAVVERTREIGTLRALGLTNAGVVRLFSLEGLWIALLGCAAGFAITVLAALAINASGIGYVPPNSSYRVLLQVDLDWPRMLLIALAVSFFAVLCAAWPAYRATRIEVVDALSFV
ncbi:FtsX-like permease family protein [Paraburkholderia sp. MMS20-SJTR3]|uniref:FtsX-like permease family protein n=1 Tax=Paraburkholderia sejongensis TaxID=2886946 RepID=A0ABS8JX66_9BURK|nr:FtsX-like permease family protein [Paraburkholderia sp. MMS20-SJTR3]MCC8394469.1 FtsX-like permease family protein [Paraburkholderia sp. MMS20-SJTR3]